VSTDRALGEKLQAKMREVVGALPEVTEENSAGDHYGFLVGGRKFAYYLDDHHGDGRIAFQCKMPPGEMGRLVELDPQKYFKPPYMARHGWVGVYLDTGEVDWDEIAGMASVAWSLVAPASVQRRA
jgi:predicted DNA-binding protein (MmcQ/YjbR family)